MNICDKCGRWAFEFHKCYAFEWRVPDWGEDFWSCDYSTHEEMLAEDVAKKIFWEDPCDDFTIRIEVRRHGEEKSKIFDVRAEPEVSFHASELDHKE